MNTTRDIEEMNKEELEITFIDIHSKKEVLCHAKVSFEKVRPNISASNIPKCG